MKRRFTVKELVDQLVKFPHDAQITLLDADTGWTIVKFDVIQDGNQVTFMPSDYTEMEK